LRDRLAADAELPADRCVREPVLTEAEHRRFKSIRQRLLDLPEIHEPVGVFLRDTPTDSANQTAGRLGDVIGLTHDNLALSPDRR